MIEDALPLDGGQIDEAIVELLVPYLDLVWYLVWVAGAHAADDVSDARPVVQSAVGVLESDKPPYHVLICFFRERGGGGGERYNERESLVDTSS